MERILVAYGRACDATGVMGLAVGEQLSRAGYQVDVRPCARAAGPTGYRAVIIGSVVHDGGWEPSAIDYATRHAPALAERPTWLYQVTESTSPVLIDQSVAAVVSTVGADEPVTFHRPLIRPEFGGADRRLSRFHRHFGNLDEWARIRLWGVLLANEVPLLAPARG